MSALWVRVCVLVVVLVIAGADEQKSEYDTIVIGAGAAGVSAAAELARAGRAVLLLEAQDYVGGRVRTRSFGDGVVELGAEWIHGTESSPQMAAAQRANVTLLSQTAELEALDTLWSDGKEAGEDIKEVINKALELSDVDSSDTNATVGDYITEQLKDFIKKEYPAIYADKHLVNELVRLTEGMTEGYEASWNWNELDPRTTSVSLGGDQHMSWHRHGYKTLFDILLNKHNGGPGLPSLTLKLNTEVTRVEWPRDTEGNVTVTCKDGSKYTARRVIVTVSVGVLKERHAALFSPPLPEKKIQAISNIAMGVIGKIILSFEKPWLSRKWFTFVWKPEDLAAVPDEDKWTTDIIGVSSSMGSLNSVVIWTIPNTTRLVEAMPDEAVKTKAVALLKRFFGADKVPEPTGFVRTKWLSNPFTRGSYTYDALGGARARDELGAPLTDAAGAARVLFAGEATHARWFGNVHGAADSGTREAKRLLMP